MLAEAPPGRHFAQFHRSPDALTESVFLFLDGGLRRGNSIVVIASPENRERLVERLSAGNVPPDARGSGQLELLDAATMLSQFGNGGVPEWARFRSAVGSILDRVRTAGAGRSIRIYAELAGMLWQDGNTDGAVRVEELWNALAGTYQFSLYCGYTLDTQSEESYAGPLEEVGGAHSDILGTDEDERFGVALDRASTEIFGISLSQMAGMTKQDGARRFPSGQRTMLWVKRNLPMSTAQITERARRYVQEPPPLDRRAP